MKKLIIPILFFLVPFISNAQDFQKLFGKATDSVTFSVAVQLNSTSGDYTLVGGTKSFTDSNKVKHSKIFYVIVDIDGNAIREFMLPGSQNDDELLVGIGTKDGGAILGGRINKMEKKNSINYNYLASSILIKFDKEGNLEWSKVTEKPNFLFKSIIEGNEGDFFGFGSARQNNNTLKAAVAKFSNKGDIQWINSIDVFNKNNLLSKIAKINYGVQLSSGNLILALDGNFYNYFTDSYLLKLDSKGNFIKGIVVGKPNKYEGSTIIEKQDDKTLIIGNEEDYKDTVKKILLHIKIDSIIKRDTVFGADTIINLDTLISIDSIYIDYVYNNYYSNYNILKMDTNLKIDWVKYFDRSQLGGVMGIQGLKIKSNGDFYLYGIYGSSIYIKNAYASIDNHFLLGYDKNAKSLIQKSYGFPIINIQYDNYDINYPNTFIIKNDGKFIDVSKTLNVDTTGINYSGYLSQQSFKSDPISCCLSFDFNNKLNDLAIPYKIINIDTISVMYLAFDESKEISNDKTSINLKQIALCSSNTSQFSQIDARNFCFGDTTEFNFNNQSFGNSITFLWSFGDYLSGTSNFSSLPNPKHKYALQGYYTITLILISPCGIQTFTKTIAITGPAKADFLTVSPCLATNTVFIDNSSPKVLYDNNRSVTIFFGDGEQGNFNFYQSKRISHKYKNAGKFMVTYIYTNSCSSDTIEREIEINGPPIANFDFELNCDDNHFEFSNKTYGYNNKYIWNFGDPASSVNNVSNKVNPRHKFSSNSDFIVSMIVINECGIDTISKIVKALPEPIPDFVIGDNCQKVVFKNISKGYTTNYYWDFGDVLSNNNTSILENPTHYYDLPGDYFVKFVAKNKCFSDSILKKITITKIPYLDFDYSNDCAGNEFIFNGYSSGTDIKWTWDFGDSLSKQSNFSNSGNPKHRFLKSGTYTIKLIGKNDCFKDSIIKEIDVNIKLMGDFDFEYDCKTKTVNFENKSFGELPEYSWNFGDTNSKNNDTTLKNPSHIYNSSGKYLIRLIVKNDENCFDTLLKEIELLPLPNSGFTGLKTEYCSSENEIKLIPKTSGGEFFGPGIINKNFFSPGKAGFGKINIEYRIKNEQNCESSTIISTNVFKQSEAFAGKDSSICYNDFYQLGSTGDPLFTYTWSPKLGLNRSDIPNPITKVIYDKNYILTVSNNGRCIAKSQVYLTVIPLPVAAFNVNKISDNVFEFKAENATQLKKFKWDFGDRSEEDTSINSSHNYLSCDKYKVVLIVFNDCGSDTIQKTINSCGDTIFSGFGNSLYSKNDIIVFPNPFLNYFTVNSSVSLDEFNIKLLNELGQSIPLKIQQESFNGKTYEYLIEPKQFIKGGIYLLETISRDTIYYNKIIKY